MIAFQPVTIARRGRYLGQTAPTLPQAPAATQPASTVPAMPKFVGFFNTLKWGTIGFVAGAATGYALGKGTGSKGGGLMDSLLGGVGGVVATVLPRLLGLS